MLKLRRLERQCTGLDLLALSSAQLFALQG